VLPLAPELDTEEAGHRCKASRAWLRTASRARALPSILRPHLQCVCVRARPCVADWVEQGLVSDLVRGKIPDDAARAIAVHLAQTSAQYAADIAAFHLSYKSDPAKRVGCMCMLCVCYVCVFYVFCVCAMLLVCVCVCVRARARV
jgi:hypothetical protein